MRRVLQRGMIPLRFRHYTIEALPALHFGVTLLSIYDITFLGLILQLIAVDPRPLLLHLHLPWFIVKHLGSTRDLSGELYKVLVGGILVYIVVTVLFVLKLDNKSVGQLILRSVRIRSQIPRHGLTDLPSGLLFLPPENDLM